MSSLEKIDIKSKGESSQVKVPHHGRAGIPLPEVPIGKITDLKIQGKLAFTYPDKKVRIAVLPDKNCPVNEGLSSGEPSYFAVRHRLERRHGTASDT